MSDFQELQNQLKTVSLSAPKDVAAPLSSDEVAKLLQRAKAIYGPDNRVDSHDDTQVPKKVINAVCVLVEASNLIPSPGGFRLQTQSFGARYRLCPGQRFRNQPTLGYGTGFLVSEDTLVTAGHCIRGHDISTICALFDFEMSENDSDIDLRRSADDVYFVAKAHEAVVEADGADYAIITLDRPVKGIDPLKLCSTATELNDPVYTVGHPCGLPKKSTTGATVLDNTPTTHFLANLDTFGGNSGSPVMNKDHEVCGILVRGAQDFVQKGDCFVATEFPLHSAGESVCRTSVWKDLLPSAGRLGSQDEAVGDTKDIGGKSASSNGSLFLNKLVSFLSSAFSASELRRLSRFNLHLENLTHAVAWDRSLRDVVEQVVDELQKHGLIGEDFFRILSSERPGRIEEVRALEELFKGTSKQTPAGRQADSSATRKAVLDARAASESKDRSGDKFDRADVFEALMGLSAGDFDKLMLIYIEQDARLLVGSRAGQQEAALSLINHYDVGHRGLKSLVEAIRKVAKEII